VGSRPAIEELKHSGVISLSSYNFDVVLIQGCGGGGSVRRRNALHEVGGRVPEEPRVRNARAGSETHTHLNIFTHTSLSHKIILSKIP
jgi:hypothetical protein